MEKIKFSILVPVYNVEEYVVECLESIHNQTYENFEVIVVDDGSTDSSGQICEEYCLNDNRFHCLHKSNGGLLQTRRFSLKHAAGDYILFVDSDDRLKDNALEVINNKLSVKRYDCIIYGYERVQDNKVIGMTYESVKEIEISDKRELYKRVFLSENYNALWRKAIKASLLNDDYSKYYSVTKGEDLLQSLEIYRKGLDFLIIEDRLYQYTYNPLSITNRTGEKDLKMNFTVYSTVTSFLEEEQIFTNDDMDMYFNHLSRCVLVSVYRIVESLLLPQDIKLLLKSAWQDIYFQEYLLHRDNVHFSLADSVCWSLFCSRRFALLYTIGRIRRYAKIAIRRKRMIREVLKK